MNKIASVCLSVFIAVLYACTSKAPDTFTNPILPGSHPDPSICRVGDTYYIVNSSFIWHPGVPIHRSTDLVNWELIGYALNTPAHLTINDKTGQHIPDAPAARRRRGALRRTLFWGFCWFHWIDRLASCFSYDIKS